ncbi:hypothetical protein [Mycolicibacter kumamotonensis]|uniref:Uncharacterized protein n=1 Tax=Mycolicibacter kumamotonensis TaxID=354243 RepID=A0A1B8SLC0_9MYCO|nr:hypothetical protein [Mycolicibacter kumamotonensis]OBY33535.1 hypothetical protein ACT18_00975 [Mycolicibacter kumamotonensis]
MYEVERKTDDEIAAFLSERLGKAVPANTVYIRRRRIGIKSDGARGRYNKDARYEQIKDQLPAVWEGTIVETTLSTGGVRRRGSAKKVGEHFGVSQGTANKWLKRAGLLADRPGRKQWGERMKSLYEQGHSIAEIAEIEDTTTGTVSRYLKQQNVEIIPSQHRRTPEQNQTVNTAISLTKVGPEVSAIFATRETALAYIRERGIRSIRGLEVSLGVSDFYLAAKIRQLGLWDELDHYVSYCEAEIRSLLGEWEIPTITTRSVIPPHEIDIYSAEHRLGIEFNGTYWHSAKFRDRNYHLEKTLRCQAIGVRLIHVWEHLWSQPHKRAIYENMITHALGRTENRVGARGTRVEKRPAIEMKSFFETNNIQGYRPAKWAYVLVDKNTGMDLMCYTVGQAYFGKGRYDMEIARGACRLGHSVSGGATKLWKAIIADNPKTNSIVYYVDLNHYDGSSVTGLPGARFIKNQPSFWNWHVRENEVRNREPQRHAEIMAGYANGSVVQVHNAGTAVYVWERMDPPN